MGKIVELKGVWVWLGSNLALKDVTLSIEQGRFVGLMGPNGGGKTTLLKTIAGLIRPDRGYVKVYGERSKIVGYVPQAENANIDFPVSVRDVVEMGTYSGLGFFQQFRPKRRDLVEKALEAMEISDLAGRRIEELSGGQRQRVYIARALAGEPSLLLLDEPTTGVDTKARDNFFRILSSLIRSYSITIILASHDIEVVPNQVDEIICINQTVYIHAPPKEVDPADLFTKVYGCEFEPMIHGKYPHRVLRKHDEASDA